jgi:putative phage-type endonuclease
MPEEATLLTTPYTVKPCETREEWLQERQLSIGGSEAAAVLGLSPWLSALELYARKSGLVPLENSGKVPEWMEWGLLLEEPIAAKYQTATGRELVDPGAYTIYQSIDRPFMACTPDRDIIPQPNDLKHFLHEDASDPLNPLFPDHLGVLEIKTTRSLNLKAWKEELPIHQQIQLQHSLAVTGRKWGSFAVLFGGQQFGWLDVERNNDFCDLLIRKEAEFWDRVQRQDPPPADDSESSADILKKLYPHETGHSVALPAEANHKDTELENIKAEIKGLDARKRGLENWFKEHIGENLFGICPDGTKYKWATTERKGYAVGPTQYRQLRRLKR